MTDSHSTLISPLPVVAIVGRPNVGKSALFNRIARRQISIVHDEPGITRDRISAMCRHQDFQFELIDTGGIGSNVDTSFTNQVRLEADLAMETADLILFVVDAQSGVHPVDSTLAAMLRRTAKPIFLVVNKVDDPKHENNMVDFELFGFEHKFATSAAHGRNTDELINAIIDHFPKQKTTDSADVDESDEFTEDGESTEDPDKPSHLNKPPKLAIIGRPNVGKSSLINAFLRQPRTIVSDISGTTRDSIDIPFEYNKRSYVLIDTAGIRPKSRHKTSVEVFSVMRSEKAIKRSDLCILVLDTSMGVTAQDKKIAMLIQRANKPCIIVLNKWDLAAELAEDEKDLKKNVMELIQEELFFLSHAPVVLVSAIQGKYVSRILRLVEAVRDGARARIGTGQLNRLLKTLTDKQPPPLRQNRRFKILYGTQTHNDGLIPPPVFVLFVNDPKLLVDSYKRFLEGQIRKIQPFPGLPLLFELRGRNPGDS